MHTLLDHYWTAVSFKTLLIFKMHIWRPKQYYYCCKQKGSGLIAYYRNTLWFHSTVYSCPQDLTMWKLHSHDWFDYDVLTFAVPAAPNVKPPTKLSHWLNEVIAQASVSVPHKICSHTSHFRQCKQQLRSVSDIVSLSTFPFSLSVEHVYWLSEHWQLRVHQCLCYRQLHCTPSLNFFVWTLQLLQCVMI